MHRKFAICAVAFAMLGCGDWTRACPEGFQYDHGRRLCVRSGPEPEVDSGTPVVPDSGVEVDAGSIEDAGDVDAEAVDGGDDAAVENKDAGTEDGGIAATDSGRRRVDAG